MKAEKRSTIKSGPIRHYTSSPFISKPHINAAALSQWSAFLPSLPQTTRRFRNKFCKFCEPCSMIGNGLRYSNDIRRIQYIFPLDLLLKLGFPESALFNEAK